MSKIPIFHKTYLEIDKKLVPVILGGKGGCFPAGTSISTPKGNVDIKDIRIGDEVISYDFIGNKHTNKVTQTFIHKDNYQMIRMDFWGGDITVTDNHWLLTEQNNFHEAKEFGLDWPLIDELNGVLPVEYKEFYLAKDITVYNFTVENDHTYIANGIRVHNKGGSKGGSAAPGREDPNTLFSTDIVFMTIALGEGPLYRINPNGLQDIEVNESTIDDLINFATDGSAKGEIFFTDNRTGILTQSVMPIFGEQAVTPQTLASPLVLKKGNLPGIPRAAINLQNTSANAWDSLIFFFTINGLQRLDDQGNVFGFVTKVKVSVFDVTGTVTIASAEREISGKTNVPFKFDLTIPIPVGNQSSNGYKFTVEKLSDDSDSAKIQDTTIIGAWAEVKNDEFAYPTTGIIGYSIKAQGEFVGAIPTFTQMVKGLLCKVPNNYNQPILESGEIDWRELEVVDDPSASDTNSYQNNGYRLQKSGSSLLTASNPDIYDGLWDGNFVISWTQNPIWILYDILTNQTYGMAIPEDNIDKFKFYKVAQYCDAIDPSTGKYQGVSGITDGTFRYKPQGQFAALKEKIIGLNGGISISERRFITDVSIGTRLQLFDLMVTIAGTFRGIMFYSGGKISINIDMPDEIPVALFNEANIEKESLSISGISEQEIITGVEVSYIEPSNHYRREVVRVDDPKALREKNQIENLAQIELTGVTRRGQAVRFAQYLLASSKFIRRKIQFSTTNEAITLSIGDIIAVSQRSIGTAWGFGGKIQSTSTIGDSNVVIEHFTSPAIVANDITGNTLPIALRVIKQTNDRVDLYIVSNTLFSTSSGGNALAGIDVAEFRVIQRFNPRTKTFSSAASDIQFSSNNVPTKRDIWTFGEIDPSNYDRPLNDKWFKVTGIVRNPEDQIQINASEYVGNVYIDSDTIISYTPVRYKDTFSPMVPPPSPIISLQPKLVRETSGSIRNDIEVFINTDRTGYPINIQTEIQYSAPLLSKTILGIV